MEEGRIAYVSMITSDDFLPGLQCMVYSLKRTKTSIPIHIIMTKQVSTLVRKKIEQLDVSVRIVEPIPNPNASSHVEGWINSGYTKLHVWNLIEFKKIVYIDADTLVLENVDELFERPCPAAAPDTFPPDRFNAGVMVVRPDETTFKDMMSKTSELKSYDTGDTGFLNAYFENWYRKSEGHRLPFGYNALRTMFWLTAPKTRGYWDAVKPLKIIHYCSSPKPWENL